MDIKYLFNAGGPASARINRLLNGDRFARKTVARESNGKGYPREDDPSVDN